ncbi:unnamed protein product, partial [Ilex paraguariensis]
SLGEQALGSPLGANFGNSGEQPTRVRGVVIGEQMRGSWTPLARASLARRPKRWASLARPLGH